MTQSDFIITIQWWIALAGIGIIFIPFTEKLFKVFFDRGYLFSKVIGLIITTYTLFVLGELHILPFTQLSIFIVLIGYLLINLFLKRGKNRVNKKIWIIYLCEEIVCFIFLLSWSFVRGNAPDIHGLEKYMDFGFVNSIVRTTYFPPKDMWLAGQSINYYYFGHMTTAMLTKLTAIPSYISFNLMIATLFALCLTGSFTIGANLLYLTIPPEKQNRIRIFIHIIAGGILTAFLTTLAGNIHTIYTFFKAYPNESPVPIWKLPFLPSSFPNGYWYPNATRFIYHTIHEFPIYSFVVSDLHGHVLDIPFVLLTLAIFLIIIISPKSVSIEPKNQTSYKIIYTKLKNLIWDSKLVITGFLLAIMYMTNAWDGLIYLSLAALILTYQSIPKNTEGDVNKGKIEKNRGRKLYMYGKMILKQYPYTQVGVELMILFLLFIIFSLPFSLFFKPFANQIGIVCPPQWLIKANHIGPLVFETDHCQHSPIWQLATLYGFFYFWILGFLLIVLRKFQKKQLLTKHSIATNIPPHQSTSDISPIISYITILIVISTLLIIAPEMVYLRDIYTTYFRANTMFKLVYQAFIMLSIVSGFTIAKVLNSTTLKQKIYLSPYIIVGIGTIVLVCIYPYFAISSYYNNLKQYQGLNGVSYLDKLYPTDAAAIRWINQNIQGQPTMLEAQGDSYTDYERVSANTGLPTILGWTVHEWLWHNSYDFIPPIQTDIQNIYESTDISKTQQLIKKYHIQYIFIGKQENEKYHINQEKFSLLGKTVYKNGQTIIYKLNE